MEIETGERNIQFGPASKKSRWAIFLKRVILGMVKGSCLPGWNFNLFSRTVFTLLLHAKITALKDIMLH